MINGLMVFLGGGLGAFVRYILCILLHKTSFIIPTGTLLANFLGCFIATVVFMYFVLKSDADSVCKTFLIVGFCGGLSTLSALSLELLEFIQSGEYVRAAAYTITTIIVCTISVILGVIFIKHFIKL